VISLFVTTLEHEKSFLLQDGGSIVNTIAFYNDSLLLTSSNDIVQKDIETGLIQRTFRAHTGTIYTFIVTDDFKMISSAWDDMIIVWNLESGSVMKRIWLKPSNTQVMTISYQSDQLYVGGLDKKLRQVDLVTDKVVIMKSNQITVNNLFS
jgi:WD40 repeat protein